MNFSKSAAYLARYPSAPFALAVVSQCANRADPPGFDQYKRKLLRKMRKREKLADIAARIDLYDRFFQDFGYECPLPKHLKRTVHSGFPKYDLLVDAHFMAEMCAGILVAVSDRDRFDGDLSLDLAKEGEAWMGMGGRPMSTKEGEVVLRDEREIVCVLCQGADEKTRVSERTRNVLFYAYSVPGVSGNCLEEGLALAAEAVTAFGGGALERLETF